MCINILNSLPQYFLFGKISGKEYSHLVMDCCQLEQECPPTVKREVLLDDNDRKSPDQDSSGKLPCKMTSDKILLYFTAHEVTGLVHKLAFTFSPDGNGPGRDGMGGPHRHDSSKSPGARSGGSDRYISFTCSSLLSFSRDEEDKFQNENGALILIIPINKLFTQRFTLFH